MGKDFHYSRSAQTHRIKNLSFQIEKKKDHNKKWRFHELEWELFVRIRRTLRGDGNFVLTLI